METKNEGHKEDATRVQLGMYLSLHVWHSAWGLDVHALESIYADNANFNSSLRAEFGGNKRRTDGTRVQPRANYFMFVQGTLLLELF